MGNPNTKAELIAHNKLELDNTIKEADKYADKGGKIPQVIVNALAIMLRLKQTMVTHDIEISVESEDHDDFWGLKYINYSLKGFCSDVKSLFDTLE